MGGICSFQFGREVSQWLHSWRNSERLETTTKEETEEERQPKPDPTNSSSSSPSEQSSGFGDDSSQSITRPKALMFLVVAVLFVLFVFGGVSHDIQFYKSMTVMTLAAPFGALIRWKLTGCNHRSEKSRLCWLPLGTLTANLLGGIISIVCTGILDRYGDSETMQNPWVDATLFAIRVGLAGSLSTVSSMVKEIVNLSEHYPGHAKSLYYASGTLISSMFLCLGIYSAIVRPN
jgi:fluoride ion exporter CrcB/FEX